MSTSAIPDVLRRITTRRRERLGSESPTRDALRNAQEPLLTESAFVSALRSRGTRGTAVIAEVKMGSPKLGDLRPRVDPERQAETYARHGAAALSVVVEPDFFFGSYQLLSRCKAASGLPAIAKDFVVHGSQLSAARDAGADAILLIAALYEAEELAAWAESARALGLVPLIETHDDADADKLEGSSWELVGVNNRDLRTFQVDLANSKRLARRLPKDALLVAESGISSRADVERLCRAGFGAFLIGESLLLADDPGRKLQSLLSSVAEGAANDEHEDVR